jgi:hypothetical protein
MDEINTWFALRLKQLPTKDALEEHVNNTAVYHHRQNSRVRWPQAPPSHCAILCTSYEGCKITEVPFVTSLYGRV